MTPIKNILDDSAERLQRASRRERLALLALFAGAYMVANYLGLAGYFRPNDITVLWLGSGIYMGALLITDRSKWPILIVTAIVGQTVVDGLVGGVSVAGALFLAFINTLEAVVGALAIRAVCGGVPGLGSVRGVLALTFVGAGLSTLVSSFIGATEMVIAQPTPLSWRDEFSIWWFSDIMGVLLVLPLILAFVQRRSQVLEPGRRWEIVFILAVLAAIVLWVFGSRASEPLFVLDQPYIVFPLVLWLILRFDVRWVVSVLFVISLLIVRFADTGLGPFSGPDASLRQIVLSVQSFVVILVFSSLMMIAIINERRAAETRRMQLEAQLRHSQKLEAIGTLAAGVAHDINNPLTGIMSYAQLIEENAETGSESREFAQEISQESEHIAAIVRSLLTFSRSDSAERKATSPAEILDSTLTLVRTLIRTDGISLEVDVADDLKDVTCNRQELRQVIMNLITNARDALNERFPQADDGKRIRIGVENAAYQNKDWVRFSVEDTGVGIDPVQLERLFDPFFTTKTRTTGTGLGLAISYGIVRDHGGRMSVKSEPGAGTTVSFDLPADRSD